MAVVVASLEILYEGVERSLLVSTSMLSPGIGANSVKSCNLPEHGEVAGSGTRGFTAPLQVLLTVGANSQKYLPTS